MTHHNSKAIPSTAHGTLTTEGFCKPLRLVSRDGSLTLDAPVKLWPARKGEKLPRPQTDRDGLMVYALPNGGEFAA